LGMSTTEMAHRMGISQSRIPALEKAEEHGSVTVASLQRAAEALGCHLLYVLVPDETLESAVREQARRRARRQLAGVTQTMLLEDQKPEDRALAEQVDEQVDELADDLVDRRGLWADD
jgi:predicted DNA-binding mobile mystery protein A